MPTYEYDLVREIFDAAVALNKKDRKPFLLRRCSGDSRLLSEVQSLLGSFDDADGFLESPFASDPSFAASQRTFNSGDMISHYRIASLLGSGGMGDVYLAEDVTLDRRVAIKVLPGEFAGDPDRLERFKKEAYAASALNHPNIVTIFEFGVDNGTHFLVSEFVEGVTLREKLKQPLPISESLDIAIQIGSALAAAHTAGIIHRDLKPENVMARDDGYIKLLDFGLAKLTELHLPATKSNEDLRMSLSAAGMILGTAAYMSPEQARGSTVDARSDIFSFGVLLYEMLAGKPPFSGDSPADLNAAVLTHAPPPLNFIDPRIPIELENVVTHALSKNREERYQTTTELVEDLQSFRTRLNSGAIRTSSKWQDFPRRAIFHNRISALAFALAAVVVIVVLTGYWFLFARQPRLPKINSIAVLPFENATGDTGLDYLSDGLSESLIDRLSTLPQLEVASRNSSFRFRGPDLNVSDVAQKLDVNALIMGRVAKQGEMLIVRVAIIDTNTNTEIWGEQFSRRSTDKISLQSEFVQSVSSHLQMQRSGIVTQSAQNVGTANPEAYDLYLKGRYHFNRSSDDGFIKARDIFEGAVEKDPKYALAYSGLAEANNGMCLNHVVPANECFPRAKAFAEKALQIDDTIAGAHAALADVMYVYDWNFTGAEREFRRAIELDPNYAHSYSQYSGYLSAVGRFDDAIAAARRASELEPLSTGRLVGLGTAYYVARDYDGAIEQFNNALELDTNSGTAHFVIAIVYADKGDYQMAISHLETAANLLPDSPDEPLMLAYVYARAGMRMEARQLLGQLIERSRHSYVPSVPFARIYAALGDNDNAFKWLEKAYNDRDVGVTFLKTSPRFDVLRSDPRFDDLIRRVGLPL